MAPVLRRLDVVAVAAALGLFAVCWLFGEYLDGRLRDGVLAPLFSLVYPLPAEPQARPVPQPVPQPAPGPAAPQAQPFPPAPPVPDQPAAVPPPPPRAATPAEVPSVPVAPAKPAPAAPAPEPAPAAQAAQKAAGHTLINKDRREYTVRVSKADGTVEVLVLKPLETRHIDQDCKLEIVGKGAASALQGNLTVYIKGGAFSFI